MSDKQKIQLYLMIQLVASSAAIFGSLYFSEVMKFPPCHLCWYQRIFMYPIVPIVLAGLYLNSRDTNKLIAPLLWIGLSVAIYHNLVYYKVIEMIVPCTESAPCTSQQLNYLNFITIPLLSAAAFLFLTIVNLFAIKLEKKESHEK